MENITEIVKRMDDPRLSEWQQLMDLYASNEHMIAIVVYAFNYGKMKGKQEERLPEYRMLKRLTRKYGEKCREPKMSVEEILNVINSKTRSEEK